MKGVEEVGMAPVDKGEDMGRRGDLRGFKFRTSITVVYIGEGSDEMRRNRSYKLFKAFSLLPVPPSKSCSTSYYLQKLGH